MHNVTSIGEILFDVYPESKKLGGAPFNFIYHIIKLTGAGNFISRVGNDDLGKEIKNLLAERNVSSEYIQTDCEHKTGITKIKLNENKVPEFIIKNNRAYDFIENTNRIEKLLSVQTDCLYFGTLAQRCKKSRETTQKLFGKKTRYFCDLNIRQKYYSKETIEMSLDAADVLKLNEDELKLVNNLILHENYDLRNTAIKILKKFNLDLICVTRGNKGAILFKENEENSVNIKNNHVVDTVGAGDAYAAMLCIGYLNKWKIEKINRIASEFASEIVMVAGALPGDNIYELFRKKISH